MLNKPHNSIVTLAAVLLALVGVSKPAKAFLLAQANVAPTTFAVPDTLPAQAKVEMSTSNSTSSINQSLKEGFTAKFPEAQVNVEAQSSEDALQALSEGKVDLAGIGRNLTATEKQKGFVAIPVSREKIAIVVSNDNSYDGNLTISQFAQIFRGEITDWSEIGGQPGAIKLIDSPDTNDTRQAFPSYPVFQESEFVTGSNAVKLEQDSTDGMIAQLGANGIGYAVANDVINRDDIKIVTMHQTQPDDERYPFSQPFNLVYQGTPSPATEAFLGFATAQGGEQVVANRVGSMSTVAAAAIASQLGNKASNAPTGTVDLPETTVDGKGNLIQPEDVAGIDGDVDTPGVDATGTDVDVDTPGVDGAGTDVDVDTPSVDGAGTDVDIPSIDAAGTDVDIPSIDAAGTDGDVDVPSVDADGDNIAQAEPDLEGSGETNSDLEGSGQLDPDLEGSGQLDPDLEGSGQLDPDLEGSGETNSDLEGSGQLDPDLEGSGETNSAIDADGDEIAPGTIVTGDAEEGAVATAKKGKWWWWLPLILGIPILAAIAVSGFGGKKKSDREPAIDIPDGNAPSGGGVYNDIPDGGDLSAVGANTATGASNFAPNTINTTSKLSGSALAGGAAAVGGVAAAANFAGRKKATDNDLDDDIDIRLDDSDDIELSSTDIDDPVIDGIPSNPVTEFTGQETKLQLTDQPTKLQTDTVEDIDGSASGSLDGTSNAGGAALAGGAAALGGAAATSGLFSDSEDYSDEDLDTTIDGEGQTNIQTGFVSEQTTRLQTNDLDSDYETNLADENVIEADRTDDTKAAQEFRGDFVLDEETTTDKLSVDTDIEDTEVGDNTSGLFDGRSTGSVATGGAAVLGGAAASGFFGNRDRTDDTDIEEIDLDTNVSNDLDEADTNVSGFTFDGIGSTQTPETDTDVEDTDIDSNVSGFFGNRDRADDTDIEEIDLDTNVSNDLDEADTNVSGFTFDGIGSTQTPETDTDVEDTDIDSNVSGFFDDRSNTGSVTASGFFGNRDRADDTDIEEIDLDTNISNDFSTDSGFADNVIADVETTSENTDNISLDEITFDDIDTSIYDNQEEISLDGTDNSADIDLDEITFDDADTSINASLEEISLDGTDNSADINLDEITFDDVDSSTDISLDSITFNDTEEKSTDNIIDSIDVDSNNPEINLDDLGFDESVGDTNPDLLSGNTAKITDLSDDRSNDMNNISTWLDSLETPRQNSEDISGWLDQLSIHDNDSDSERADNKEFTESNEETEDISFQFLEDLLERDSDKENS